MGKRTNTARWTGTRWRIDVQKDGRRRSFYSGTPGRTGQREANAKADAWLDEGLHDGGQRVETVWALYLADLKQSAGTSYYNQVAKFGENYILPVCGRVRISALTEGELQDVLNRAYKNGCLRPGSRRRPHAVDGQPLSRKTLQGIRATETAFLKWCRKHRYTTLAPEDLAIPKGARLKGKTILQPDALRVLFSVDTVERRGKLVQDEYIYAYRFAAATGLRPGELAGLWVGDVKGRRVDLARAVNQLGEVTQGKNENALRTFEMNDYAYAAYTAQLEQLRAAGVELNYNTPLFPMRNQKSLYNHWKLYQEKNGIAPPISLYELRHTFVSLVQDLPDGKLKALVGHSGSMDTRGIYGHAVEGSAAETAGDLTQLLGRVLG